MAFKDPPVPDHVPGTRKGEEMVIRKGHEAGRAVPGSRYYRTARDSTSINPQARAPIDPRMPDLPPA
jgi:hypothetical protein